MKLFLLVIAASFGAILSEPAPESQNLPKDDNTTNFLAIQKRCYALEDLAKVVLNTEVSRKDLTYHFFDQRDPSEGVEISGTNMKAMKKTTFSSHRNTVFLIHCWTGDRDSAPLNHEVKKAMLLHNDVNIFVVDWGPVAARDYATARVSVVSVGKHVANFIRFLMKRYHLSLSMVALIGFSLGAQVAGNVGAALNGEVDLIVGLDPAGPFFCIGKTDDRLDPTDGQYVHVIHTNGGFLGFMTPCGHSDYYPNGGSRQLGCGLDAANICAHSRAYEYYAESLLKRKTKFKALKCSSFWKYKIGLCNDNPTSFLGGYPVDRKARGTYHLDTNPESPFAKPL